MELRDNGRVVLTEREDNCAIISLAEALHWISKKDFTKLGKIYDKAGDRNPGRFERGGENLRWNPVELSRRQSRYLGEMARLAITRSTDILARAATADETVGLTGYTGYQDYARERIDHVQKQFPELTEEN